MSGDLFDCYNWRGTQPFPMILFFSMPNSKSQEEGNQREQTGKPGISTFSRSHNLCLKSPRPVFTSDLEQNNFLRNRIPSLVG